MSLDRFNNKYRVPSARALWHDYNAGMYFVTICTKDKVHYFGEIGVCRDAPQLCRDALQHVSTTDTATNISTATEPTMKLSEVGKYADEQLRNIATHYSYAEIPLWVVMPNHIHMVVVINHDKIPYERRNVEKWCAANVETRCSTSLPRQSQPIHVNRSTSAHRDIANMQGWLSVVIGGIKRAVTRFANEKHLPFAWQPRFNDRIIRNTDELNRIANYIENNVVQWYNNGDVDDTPL